MTITSALLARTFIGRSPRVLRHAEKLHRLAQARDFYIKLLLVGLERLLAAIDPDHGNLLLQARLDVVVVARSNVDPALLAADPALALGEVRRIRFVGADLLNGDDEVEVERNVATSLPEQLVIDVRNQP